MTRIIEEVAIYYSMYLILQISDMLEECPFLRMTLPWGSLSSLRLAQRNESDDGPILWVRPGEQLIPTAEIGLTPNKRMWVKS